MKTKMLSLLLASGVVLAACGQGGSGDEGKKSDNDSNKTEQNNQVTHQVLLKQEK